MVAISARGENFEGGTLILMDSKTNEIINKVTLSGEPGKAIFNPVNERIYLTAGFSSVFVIDKTTGLVINELHPKTFGNIIGLNQETNELFSPSSAYIHITKLDASPVSFTTNENYRVTKVEGFPQYDRSPQHYIDRYNSEPLYKEWFDELFSGQTIQDVVLYKETNIDEFPDNSQIPEYYITRYYTEEEYTDWF